MLTIDGLHKTEFWDSFVLDCSGTYPFVEVDCVFASDDIGKGASLRSGLGGGFVFGHCDCGS